MVSAGDTVRILTNAGDLAAGSVGTVLNVWQDQNFNYHEYPVEVDGSFQCYGFGEVERVLTM